MGDLVNKNYQAIWFSNLTSELGGIFFTVCISIIIFDMTNSVTSLGSVWLIYYIPSFFMQLFIGPYIDRWSRKYTMIVCQVIRGLLALLLCTLIITDSFTIILLYVIQICIGLIMPVFSPASQAILPTVVHRDLLQKANASLDSVRQLAAILGPIFAGLLLDFINVQWILIGIACAFCMSVLALFFIEEPIAERTARQPWIKEFKDGFHQYLSNPLIVVLGIFFGFVQFGVGVTIVTTLPFITSILDQPYVSYGIFMAGFPIGYIIGAMITAKIPFKKSIFILFLSLFIGGLTYLSLAFTPWFVVAIITECIAGIVIAIFNIFNITLIQKTTPESSMGKVTSIRLLIMRTMLPLGILIATVSAEWLTIRQMYFGIGSIICISSILGYFYVQQQEKIKFDIQTYTK